MKLKILMSPMLGLTLLVPFGVAHGDVELSFGVYTSNKPTAMVRKFRPVLDALEERLAEELGEPVKVRIQVAKDYSQGIEHLASGKVDFSRFGPASYVEAKQTNPELRILAMERENGEKVFYGIICVTEDSSIHSVQDLKNKSFAFGSEKSTIGRYLSQLYLREHGVFATDLTRYDYLGRHDKVGGAVGAGDYDAGALNESTFKKLTAKGTPIRELARFPNVTKPWIARAGLPDRLFQALQNALLKIDDSKALAALKKDGFVLGDDQDFDQIRAAIDGNAAFFNPDERASVSTLEGSNPQTDTPGHDSGGAGTSALPASGADELAGDSGGHLDAVTDHDAGAGRSGADWFISVEAS
jgi:phosphonate transport system substrate-binding protein